MRGRLPAGTWNAACTAHAPRSAPSFLVTWLPHSRGPCSALLLGLQPSCLPATSPSLSSPCNQAVQLSASSAAPPLLLSSRPLPSPRPGSPAPWPSASPQTGSAPAQAPTQSCSVTRRSMSHAGLQTHAAASLPLHSEQLALPAATVTAQQPPARAPTKPPLPPSPAARPLFLCAHLLLQVALAHTVGGVYLNCCSTLRASVPQERQRKVPRNSSGRTCDHPDPHRHSYVVEVPGPCCCCPAHKKHTCAPAPGFGKELKLQLGCAQACFTQDSRSPAPCSCA